MLTNEIIEKLRNKNKRVISRLISIIENEEKESAEILKQLHSRTGNAYRIGITGPPGAGKSTLTNALTKTFRHRGRSVGIIAVDPTSPFTGGALLGDRVRMSEIGGDPQVYIRSMATRGSMGGLSKKTIDAADIIDSAGFDIIIFETVGVGQSELDIAAAADSTLVVLVPESGDAIQAMKAGLMEIADFFVMNKSDRPGAETAYTALKTILSFRPHDEKTWLTPILKTVASENKNISEVFETIVKHREYLESGSFLKNRRESNYRLRIKEIVHEYIIDEIWNNEREHELKNSLEKVVLGNLSPYELAEEIINNFKQSIK